MSEQRRGPGGSVPDPTVRDRVLDAFVALVGDRGLHEVSLDDIAAAAGVSKVTMYTRWSSRRHLVAEAFMRLGDTIPVLDADAPMRSTFDVVFARLDDPSTARRLSQLLAELTAAAGTDTELREVLHDYQARWRDLVIELIEHGKRTGEVPADRDTEVLAELLMATSTMRHLMGDLPIDDGFTAMLWSLATADEPLGPS